VHVGLIASSDVFYDPDNERFARLAARGTLAVEMEAAALYTIAALRGVEALCMLTVSDILYDGEPQRISDDELRVGVDRMMRVALDVAVA
jgi:5'-methylthioadenosine phosphorylase/purine-nucleoside phosphorylase